jgi:stage II sporulation protein AA (anti-sigma F factor antagonist)
MDSNIKITISDAPKANAKVVIFEGELDEVSLDEVKVQMHELLNNNAVQKILLDFSKLEFINSKGIGYIVSMHTHMTKNGRQLMVADARQAVYDVISLVGLTSIIPYFETLDKAIAAL